MGIKLFTGGKERQQHKDTLTKLENTKSILNNTQNELKTTKNDLADTQGQLKTKEKESLR